MDPLPSPIVIFHRANTLALCQEALAKGAPMIEFDLRRTGDGTIVVFHDPEVNKKKLSEITYQELKTLALPTEVPTLEEYLIFCQNKFHLDVELKESGYEAEVIELVLKYFSPSQIVVTSFVDKVIQNIKRLYPHISAGFLVARYWPNSKLSKYIPALRPIRRAQKANADFIAPHYHLLKMGLLRRAENLNLPVYVWTVNQEKMIAKLLQEKKVAALITDHLSFALETQKKIL